jgi:hypothetical protein
MHLPVFMLINLYFSEHLRFERGNFSTCAKGGSFVKIGWRFTPTFGNCLRYMPREGGIYRAISNAFRVSGMRFRPPVCFQVATETTMLYWSRGRNNQRKQTRADDFYEHGD